MVVFEGYQCEIAWATNDKFETLILIVPLFSKGTRHQALLGPRCPAAPAPSTACSQRSIIRAEGPAVRAAVQALALSHKGLDTQYLLLSGWISRFSDFWEIFIEKAVLQGLLGTMGLEPTYCRGKMLSISQK